MATGDRKVNIFLKKFLSQQNITETFFDFLEKKIRDVTFRVFRLQGLFEPNPDLTPPLSADTPDSFDIFTPLVGTDGPAGNILQLDPLYADNVPFENTLAAEYFVGLKFVPIPREVEKNVRTGEIKYSFYEDGIGELADPDVVVDDGDETLTLTVDSVTEAGVSNAGRKVLVFLKNAKSEVQAFEELTVIWDGSNNKIETVTALGQTLGSISTNAADYSVILLGPSVKKNTDLTLDPNVLYLGKVTGAGAGNTPSTFDFTGVNKIIGVSELQFLLDSTFAFLTGGGNITWDLATQTLTFALDVKLRLPHRGFDFTITATSVGSIADGDVLYIVKDQVGGVKPIIKVANGSMPNTPEAEPIAFRDGNDIFFRNGALELKGDASSSTIGRIDGITQDLLDYIGATDESDADPDYTNALGPAVSNLFLSDGESLTQSLKRLEQRDDTVIKVDLVDLVNTSLPAGVSATIDGQAVVNGDRVLFVQAAIEGVYEVSGVGVALVWTKLSVFGETDVPANGALVAVKQGTSEYFKTTWERTSAAWKPIHARVALKLPTGFADVADSELGFVDGTRTFSVQPLAPATFFDVFVQGRPFRFTAAQSVVIADLEGLHYIYFDSSGAIQSTQVYSDALLKDNALVGVVYWDATNSTGILVMEDRHGLEMSGATRSYIRKILGARLESGLAIGNYTDAGDGTLDAHAQLSLTDGVVIDSDIELSVVDNAAPSNPFEQILDPIAELPIYYKNGVGGDWRKLTTTQYPVNLNTSRINWNQFTGGAWQLTEVSNDGYFAAAWIFVTKSLTEPVIVVMGQNEWADLASAQAGETYNALDLTGLPVDEIKSVYRLIFITNSSFANAVKAAIRDVVDVRALIDSEFNVVASGGMGGGGGSSADVLDEGVSAVSAPTELNFRGIGVEAFLESAGRAGIDVIDYESVGALISALERIEAGATPYPMPGEVADSFASDKGTLTNLIRQGNALTWDTGFNSGTYERTRNFNAVLKNALGIVKARLQHLAPKNTALTPSSTAAAVTFTFDGDLTDILQTSKDVLIAHRYTDDGRTHFEVITESSTKAGTRVSRFNVSAVSYSAGPNETTVTVDNPNGSDLSFGLASSAFHDAIRLIPFDYIVQTKSLSAGAYQAGDGMELVDLSALEQIGIQGEALVEVITASITGSIMDLKGGVSPNGTYAVVRIYEETAGNSTIHWFYSKDSMISWTHFSTTKDAGFNATEEFGYSWLFEHATQIIVADNGKFFGTYITFASNYNAYGIYANLSDVTPTLTDSADIGGGAGVIGQSGAVNHFTSISGDTADLSRVSVMLIRSDNVANMVWYTNGGATFDVVGSATFSHAYAASALVFESGTSGSHRTGIVRTNSADGRLYFRYYDEGDGVVDGDTQLTTIDSILMGGKNIGDNVILHYCQNTGANYSILDIDMNSGGAPVIGTIRQPITQTFIQADFYTGRATSDNAGAFRRIIRNSIFMNPASIGHVFSTGNFLTPTSDGIQRALLFEVSSMSGFVGSHITQSTNDQWVGLRDVAAREQVAQTINVASRIRTVAFRVMQNGKIPEGYTLTCEIQGVSGGVPDGTPVATAVNSYDPARITKSTNGQLIFFNFDAAASALSGDYAPVLKATYPVSASNYIGIRENSTSVYASGQRATYNGSTWGGSTADLVFDVSGEWIRDVGQSEYSTSSENGTTDIVDQEPMLELMDSSNLMHTVRRVVKPTDSYRKTGGHIFKRTLGINSPGTQATISDAAVFGFDPTKYDKNLTWNIALGTDECTAIDRVTGAFVTGQKGEDRSGINFPIGTGYVNVDASNFVNNANMFTGKACTFNGTDEQIAYPSTLTLHDLSSIVPWAVEVEFEPAAVGGAVVRSFVSKYSANPGIKGWDFRINGSGFLELYIEDTGGGTSLITASDAVESTSYHKVRATFDGTTVKLWRTSAAPHTSFTEVASYSAQDAARTTVGGELRVGGDSSLGFYFSGDIGYVKFSKGKDTFVYDNFNTQPSLTSPVLLGDKLVAMQRIGKSSDTADINYIQAGVANPNATEQSVVDSNDLYLVYAEKIASANQGKQAALKFTMGRVSARDTSRFLGHTFRFGR